MGTGANMSSAEKLAALATRRAELEALLAAKNEELYALCVQEVQLTGVVPPEAPLSPEAPVGRERERRSSVRSAAASDGDSESTGASAGVAGASAVAVANRRRDHKNLVHRLSTPSISGVSTKSGHTRSARRLDTIRTDCFSPPHETFSIPSSHTYPNLAPRREPPVSAAPPVVYRHHTLTTDYMNKIYYNTAVPEAQNVSRLRETHFSSSHPDIATHYNHAAVAPQPASQSDPRATPLLYQYASQLKAQNQHLTGLNHHHMQSKRRSEIGRRNTLQRTQTYHLTSHSDYTGHLDSMTGPPQHSASPQHRSHTDVQTERDYYPHVYVPMEMSPPVPNTLHPRERNLLRSNMHLPLQPEGEQRYRNAVSPVSQMSGYSQGNLDSGSVCKYSAHGEKVKEKQWYETSLDSPTSSVRADPPLPKKSANVKRTPSLGACQTYELMSHQPPALSPGRNSQVSITSPHSEVSLESPNNCTVVEQGKCIPYREVTKPFEMSDFYKYSTKFRQANQKVIANTLPSSSANSAYRKSPMELPHYASQEHWHCQNH